MFMMGKSSSHTIATLSKFNGIVSWLCYEEFGIKPEYIPAISARKKCGITIKRGTKAKEQVMAFLLDNEPDFSIEYTRTGKPKPHCYDEADSSGNYLLYLHDISTNYHFSISTDSSVAVVSYASGFDTASHYLFNENMTIKLPCNHWFHKECILDWFTPLEI